jgi:hypothetical protein
MLFDGDGNRMTPSHAVKKDTRYRYYVSRSLITKDRTEDSTGLRVPAAEIVVNDLAPIDAVPQYQIERAAREGFATDDATRFYTLDIVRDVSYVPPRGWLGVGVSLMRYCETCRRQRRDQVGVGLCHKPVSEAG